MVTPGGLVVLTDRRSAAGPLVQVVAAAIRGGAAWVILRERDLGYAERTALAAQLRPLLPPGRLIVAGPDPLGGSAVHLSAADPVPAGVPLVGRSWHGTEPLSDVDYVTLSPVYLTATKPGYGPALGPAGAAELVNRVPRSPAGGGTAVGRIPWLALGGVDSAARAAECAEAGAEGIAVLGAIMRAANPARVASELAGAFAAAKRRVAGRDPAARDLEGAL
ncbi:thiamine-phosphate pyrophosphorylase [Actinoplanes lutulentus]|uniref:Thiamine-phosphate pyrophosphorylase n=1 Tax=Actinoplanes lutulentus TaxID=1287878 RepID=A0A327ZH26_9ACTN|nr:thiamine phosphate synthase [Actinoplanes lutulentus]MBB2945416.1 thiamine-phosphate pyrophosphorylase [Actinoplanes lutulentus]RAK40452.1 thiamine-phosphate pyrophosphorylase [Actinoplanes lutulentus]